jgi:SAM-dependent methyltransferase
MESLADIFTRIGHFGSDAGHNDKGSTHSYIETYERLFAPFRESGSILEIGLASGMSLELWSEYFGPKATITGADISITFDTSRFDRRVKVVEADATSQGILDKLGAETFDIIIDDGSHMEADQATTFQLLSSRVRPGGIYIIEDIISPDQSVPNLLSLHSPSEFIDLRAVKGRFDDGLIVFQF